MKGIFQLCLAILGAVAISEQVCAQAVVPDSTLGTVVTGNPNFMITGGTRPNNGSNLFHSFSQFSVPTGGTAFFDNALNVSMIFSRVTGGTVSNIDGMIQANGTASLFLLNPAGILFGNNAQLNIGGSFVGTTANSIQFADGTEFSAVNPSRLPLLTMSAPIGLQMGHNPGAITVQGRGNQLFDITGFGQASAINSPTGLQAGANQTLALIGGAVTFSGGVASIQGSGHLEVGSVSRGTVGLQPTPTGWVGDYSAVQQFNDIHLGQESLLNASGSNGSIQLQGQNIRLTEGSAALLQNLGSQPAGGITVNAKGSLILQGNTSNGELGSLIQSNNLNSGQVGDILISAAQLFLRDSSRIMSRTRSATAGANININVNGMTEITGFNNNNPAVYTAVATFSVGSGNAGNIALSTENLKVLDSGAMISVAARDGNTGIIQVNAAKQVEIAGYNPVAFSESSLSTYTQGAGNANRAVINTARLVITGGASLGSSTAATGSAGNVEVNASESIEIEGQGTAGNAVGTFSRIYSNAEEVSPEIQTAFGLPPIPRGNSGSLTINTPSLRLSNGGAVSVQNDGPGIGGNVQIIANDIQLENQSRITAVAQSGEGGNINLQLRDLLLMRSGSSIAATAGGQGDGGNITINTPIIVGLENSDIVANADQGRGGNIQITTQGIIGLQYRDRLTLENDITASSEFGVNGTVEVNNVGVDPNSGLVELSTTLIDSNQQVAASCSGTQGSSFVVTGRGGMPQNPNQEVDRYRSWNDVRDLAAFHKTAIAPAPTQTAMLVEATNWHRNSQTGKVELVAAHSTSSTPSATCASTLNSTRSPI
ncbi:filamentous hemagglutinin N-terminal domain-containing protein [Leptolyngbya boryana CZ1]|uniref:Filamentous hemagglutinin N-terminal domain-containing protein n=1 Tax=Leptolyngbya boryana CZ1 TaxID=3060204 RepID=A0AA96WQD4_LEPBY|nr:filamentous hemagglutinin N-terminal domain-containing protein [Leptolyngbya boryana]WNZ43683.1 filamentous hemagglutinin N-terminal domain-containing protein [Leptolyngbya boryana CZ1]